MAELAGTEASMSTLGQIDAAAASSSEEVTIWLEAKGKEGGLVWPIKVKEGMVINIDDAIAKAKACLKLEAAKEAAKANEQKKLEAAKAKAEATEARDQNKNRGSQRGSQSKG